MYDISNKRRLGLTEFEAVNDMKKGVLEIIKEESKLTWSPKPLPELWTSLSTAKKDGKTNSLLSQVLTEDVYNKLKDTKTSLKGTLAHCINSGIMSY